jgi:cysteine synthase
MNRNPSSSVLTSAVEAIGDSKMVELSRMTQNEDGRILAKLEFLNPGFSKKDRVARQIIEDAEADGSLKPGQTVVELTSGNTGTGLAIVCGVKGYPFIAVMSKGNSIERARMMRALGAETVLVDQLPDSLPGQVSGGDLDRVEHVTRQLVLERNAFRADQFQLAGSMRAHYLHTGPEALRQSGQKLNVFCDFAGSGGSFAGCAAAFKEFDPAIQCYVIEPEGAEALSGKDVSRPQHRIQGGGYSKSHLPLLDEKNIDGYLAVTEEEAMTTARLLAKEEGLFTGFSSGANVAVALRLLRTTCRGKIILVLLNDSGLKYLSTDLWP